MGSKLSAYGMVNIFRSISSVRNESITAIPMRSVGVVAILGAKQHLLSMERTIAGKENTYPLQSREINLGLTSLSSTVKRRITPGFESTVPEVRQYGMKYLRTTFQSTVAL